MKMGTTFDYGINLQTYPSSLCTGVALYLIPEVTLVEINLVLLLFNPYTRNQKKSPQPFLIENFYKIPSLSGPQRGVFFKNRCNK